MLQKTIDFFIPCAPFTVTHHAKRIVRIGKFARLADKPELVQARRTYESLLLPFRIPEPIKEPIVLGLFFKFPFPKSAPLKHRVLDRVKTTKPDCSNLAKTFEDCLVRMGFFEGDQQVVKLIVSKTYSNIPGVRVIIEKLFSPIAL